LALLLNIDTATEIASICISQNARVLAYRENRQPKEHASFVHAAVGSLLRDTDTKLNDIDAFAITSGPGSYTGLRVAMAAAKGFCYALDKPLIALNTLEVMAQAALEANSIDADRWLCPMLDARRMEVFTAVYDRCLDIKMAPGAIILEEGTFEALLLERGIVFFGNGSNKLRDLKPRGDAQFLDVIHNATHLAILAEKSFYQQKFSDVSYLQPEYLKDFQLSSKR
jgi:tRNA threonylcarbamoyladenosine biosynthesis protein TsaB